MRRHFFVGFWGLAALMTGAYVAPAAAIDQPFPTVVEGEALAVQAVPQPAASPTVVSATGVASPTSLGLVKGVVVVMTGTAGYDREGALAVAAKKALPTVLERLPMPAETAKTVAKTVGDPQKFVKSYTVVKESILPQYQLTADLLFDEAMLRKNFGGKIVKKVQVQVPLAVSGTLVSATQVVSGSVPVPPVAEETVMTVVIPTSDPATVDRIYTRLAGTAATVTYKALTTEEARLTVKTTLTIDTLTQLVAPEATVELAAPEGPGVPAGAVKN